ncbi:MAG: hypothetical protein WCW25_00095 [Patescibacteria group bacterium]|jgi:hypothetical protein
MEDKRSEKLLNIPAKEQAEIKRKNWDEFVDSLQFIKNSIFQRAKKFNVGGQNGMLWLNDQYIKFTEKVKKAIPDHEKYAGYHIFGSTPEYSRSPHLDLPGEYSAVTFFENLERELDELEKGKQE